MSALRVVSPNQSQTGPGVSGLSERIQQLGRAAQIGGRGPAQKGNGTGKGMGAGTAIHGVPARVLPFSLWHTASAGIDVWLSALAYGDERE